MRLIGHIVVSPAFASLKIPAPWRTVQASARLFALTSVLTCAATSAVQAADSARARAFYKEGKVNFALGKFAEAIRAWEEGFKESSNPEFLYNIGQAHRLAGDPAKALFFYKSYLRQSSSAKNAAEVEEKIDQLQAQLDAASRAAAPAVVPPPPPPSPAIEVQPEAKPAATVQATSEITEPRGPIDFGVALGLASWLAGTANQGGTALAANLGGGFTFENEGSTRFRLGGSVGFAAFDDRQSSATFWTALLAPGVVHRLSERLALRGEVGLGLAVVSGLGPESALLDPTIVKVNGALPRFEIRPAALAAYQVNDGISMFLSPAVAFDLGRDRIFPDTAVRLELNVGASFQMEKM